MKDDKLPASLKPYVSRLESLYDPPQPKPKRLSNSTLQPIGAKTLDMLVDRLNSEKTKVCKWMHPEKWALLSDEQAFGVCPVQAKGIPYKRVMYKDVWFTTFSTSQANSFVVFKDSAGVGFGRIFSIFLHRRSPNPTQNIFDTWLNIQCFPPIPSKLYEPFRHIQVPEMKTYLRAWGPTQDKLIKLDEIVSHCSWLMYKPGEVDSKLQIPTVALVCMDR